MISYSYSLEVTYSNPEHPHTRPNEPKCKIYGKIENRLETLRVSRPEENMRYRWEEEGGARTASEGTKT